MFAANLPGAWRIAFLSMACVVLFWLAVWTVRMAWSTADKKRPNPKRRP